MPEPLTLPESLTLMLEPLTLTPESLTALRA